MALFFLVCLVPIGAPAYRSEVSLAIGAAVAERVLVVGFFAISVLESQLSPGRITLCPSLDLLRSSVVLVVFLPIVPGLLSFLQDGFQDRYAHDQECITSRGGFV